MCLWNFKGCFWILPAFWINLLLIMFNSSWEGFANGCVSWICVCFFFFMCVFCFLNFQWMLIHSDGERICLLVPGWRWIMSRMSTNPFSRSRKIAPSWMVHHWLVRRPSWMSYGYGSIPINTIFLGGWTSIYQLFWCSPGVQGFDTLPYNQITHYWLMGQVGY